MSEQLVNSCNPDVEICLHIKLITSNLINKIKAENSM